MENKTNSSLKILGLIVLIIIVGYFVFAATAQKNEVATENQTSQVVNIGTSFTMVSPANDSTFEIGEPVTFGAVIDRTGVGHVTFVKSRPAGSTSTTSTIGNGTLINGVWTLTAAPFTEPGYYHVWAIANNCTPSCGYAMTSPISVTVGDDTDGPVVSITSPAGATLPNGGNVSVTATASDASGIRHIIISIDGKGVKSCANAITCTYQWKMNTVAPGAHTIKAIALDGSVLWNSGEATKTVTK